MSVNLFLHIERKNLDGEWECLPDEVSDLINPYILRSITDYGREGTSLASREYNTMSQKVKAAFSHQVSTYYDSGKEAWESGIKEFSHHLTCDVNGFLEKMEKWSKNVDTCHQPVYFKWLGIPWDLLEYNWLDWTGNEIPESIKNKLPKTDEKDIDKRKEVFADTVRKMFLNGEISKEDLKKVTDFEDDGHFTYVRFADSPYEAIERVKYRKKDAAKWFGNDESANVVLAEYNKQIWDYDDIKVITLRELDSLIKEKGNQLKKYTSNYGIDSPIIEAIRLAVSNNPLIFGNDALEKFNKAVRKVDEDDEDYYDEEYAEDLRGEYEELNLIHNILSRLSGYDELETRLLYIVE